MSIGEEDITLDWVLVVYFIIAAQPASAATQIPMQSEKICEASVMRVRNSFAQFWATKRGQYESRKWEKARKRAGQVTPTSEIVRDLMTGKLGRDQFDKLYELGSSGYFFGPAPAFNSEDQRVAKSNIFTVCLPTRSKNSP
ncbi:MAG: hypothetical protein VW169_11580 [Rhodospirillaceae bacterium]